MRLVLRQPCGPASSGQLGGSRAQQPSNTCSHCMRAQDWQQVGRRGSGSGRSSALAPPSGARVPPTPPPAVPTRPAPLLLPMQARPAARRTIVRSRRPAAAGAGGDLHQPPEEEPEAESSSIPDTLPLATADSDWRAFRAKLVASSKASAAADEESASGGVGSAAAAGTADAPWAHSLPGPEQGCLLLVRQAAQAAVGAGQSS